ncbi:cobalt/zinc/cadmium resistance heavy metal efflux pump protein [Gluconacetobacter johannae DSM 13595]|uniref:TolC family protein n=1 Tax=Gluconacetobacter johannae TaxID=112140 RepID=A0A7W4J543_9PROT|nr:TolC family protein [Gluconacetobacter johannae]MBB2174826.1 TolC family protein [Gluconacetobacter johannae]GBQ79474.1 cobalt/zinc/cadmium resistance heavy metal efflux pump protein [Gluconacetobacter johannae DSM 13595]
MRQESIQARLMFRMAAASGLLALLLWQRVPARAESLTFHEAVSAAWAIDPGRSALLVNRSTADARADAAKSWFPGGPTVNGQYFDDHAVGSNEGYTTYQGGVSVPLWLPGQGSATVRVAQAESATVQERLNVEHMAVAVRVLDAAAAEIVAERREAIALSLRGAMQRIEGAVRGAVHAGEAAVTDRDAAAADLANARTEVENAREQRITAASLLAELLGRPGLPDIMFYDDRSLGRTRIGTPQLVEDNDPRVRAAHRAVMAAEEGLKLARASFMPNPEVGIAAIHEKQYGSPWDNRVGVNVTIPLPSEARNVPIMADARNKVAAADSDERQARRMVRLELAQVRARVDAAAEALGNARVAAGALNKRANDMERSWRLQETSLVEALRARQGAYTALLTFNQAEVAWHTAILRAMIATGFVP